MGQTYNSVWDKPLFTVFTCQIQTASSALLYTFFWWRKTLPETSYWGGFHHSCVIPGYHRLLLKLNPSLGHPWSWNKSISRYSLWPSDGLVTPEVVTIVFMCHVQVVCQWTGCELPIDTNHCNSTLYRRDLELVKGRLTLSRYTRQTQDVKLTKVTATNWTSLQKHALRSWRSCQS